MAVSEHEYLSTIVNRWEFEVQNLNPFKVLNFKHSNLIYIFSLRQSCFVNTVNYVANEIPILRFNSTRGVVV